LKVYFDTNVLVAALIQGHPHHRPARLALSRVTQGTDQGHISSHGLTELYSVLTRTPFVPRVLPVEAWEVMASEVLPHFVVQEMTGSDYRRVLEQCSRRGWSGGRVFDVLHIEAARKASCERLLTFNFREFDGLSPEPAGWIAAPTF